MSKALYTIMFLFVAAMLASLPMQEAEAKRFGSGGLGSILGALVMGGLLAAIFMGGGFENINFFDILIFGLIAFMLFKLFAARRHPAVSHASTGNGFRDVNEEAQPQQVREVWYFIKPVNGLYPTWYLDGIQQLEQ